MIMGSLASSMEFERRKFERLSPYDFTSPVSGRVKCNEHDECGETALYPLSPLSLTLYFAFDYETEIG